MKQWFNYYWVLMAFLTIIIVIGQVSGCEKHRSDNNALVGQQTLI